MITSESLQRMNDTLCRLPKVNESKVVYAFCFHIPKVELLQCKDLFHRTSDVLAEFGLDVEGFEMSKLGDRKRRSVKKPHRFEKEIEKLGPRVSSLTWFCGREKYDSGIDDRGTEAFCAHIGSPPWDYGHYAVFYIRNSIIDLIANIAGALTRDFVEITSPYYAYALAVNPSPTFVGYPTASSVNATDVFVDRLEGRRKYPFKDTVSYVSEAVSAWQFAQPKEFDKQGLLREAYRENMLTSIHLKHDCKGQTFQQWIESDPAHGTLQLYHGEMWLWSIPDDCLQPVEESLYEFGLLKTRDELQEIVLARR